MNTNGYKPTIGLEVHAELNTKSKMFCGCKNEPQSGEPNTNICPICLAHPGTLPVPNEEAIKKVLQFGVAVNATAANYSEFDRKNYFYPDIPKAYQISQYAFPFLTSGEINGVLLTRVHLEEDTAKSQHSSEGSLVDFNRAGVPLMELVTEPVIHDAKTAGNFARELQLIMRTLSISDAEMENGQMRVEANISVSKDNTLGTKVEVKNLNSFRSVEQAIEYEIARQVELLEKGEKVVQETRGWDESKGKTFSQRLKETANDYRYFPDPDIPKISLEKRPEWTKSRLLDNMPKMPQEKREEYLSVGLDATLIDNIISNRYLDEVFARIYNEEAKNKELLVLASNYITSDISSYLAMTDKAEPKLSSKNLVILLRMLLEGKINSRIAKDLLREILFTDQDPAVLAQERGLLQTSDPEQLTAVIEEIISENEKVVAEYLAGKEASIQFLVGQGMKKSKGTANPGLLLDLLKKRLSQ